MSKNTDSIIQIVKAGGSIVVSCDKKNTDNLIRIAIAARESGVNLTVTEAASKTTDNLLRIAKAYPKGVTFVLD